MVLISVYGFLTLSLIKLLSMLLVQTTSEVNLVYNSTSLTNCTLNVDYAPNLATSPKCLSSLILKVKSDCYTMNK